MRMRSLVLLAAMIGVSAPVSAETLRPDFAVCRNKDLAQKVVRASVDGDLAAIDQMLAKGACKGTQGGERVRVLERGAGYATIQFSGSRQRWVTVIEAVGK